GDPAELEQASPPAGAIGGGALAVLALRARLGAALLARKRVGHRKMPPFGRGNGARRRRATPEALAEDWGRLGRRATGRRRGQRCEWPLDDRAGAERSRGGRPGSPAAPR